MKSIFDNPKTTTLNPSILSKRANVSIETAKKFLQKQEAYQLLSTQIKRVSVPITALYPNEQWQMDLTFIEGKPVLTMIDVYSRFALAIRLPNKSATAEKLRELMTSNPIFVPESISTDNGGEFMGRGFGDLMKEFGIDHRINTPGDHRRLSLIETFHRTLKEKLLLGKEVSGSKSVLPLLDSVIYNYDTSPHQSLAMHYGRHPSPVEVFTGKMRNPPTEDQIRRRELANKLISQFEPGTRVRIFQRKEKLAKGVRLKWSKTLYEVERTEGYKVYLRGRNGPKGSSGHRVPKPVSFGELKIIREVPAGKQAETEESAKEVQAHNARLEQLKAEREAEPVAGRTRGALRRANQ